MRKTLTALSVLAITALASPAWGVDVYFTDGDTADSYWTTPGNWSTGSVPDGDMDSVFIGSNKTCVIPDGGGTLTVYDRRLRLGTTTGGGADEGDNDPGGGGPGTLQINDGANFYQRIYLHYGCQDMGTIVQNGGTATWADTEMSWVKCGCSNQSSMYELHSGTATWPNNKMLFQLDDGSNGVSADIIQTGGELNILGLKTNSGGWFIGCGTLNNCTAEYRISDGALTAGDVLLMKDRFGNLASATNTTVTFHVVGSGPAAIDIVSYEQTIGYGSPGAESVLHAEIDDGGITMINVSGTASFVADTFLKVGWEDGATPVPGTWTILTAGDIVDYGLVLHGDVNPSLWYFQVIEGGGSDTIEVTYIPEPTTICLLGLGGLGLLRRRRR